MTRHECPVIIPDICQVGEYANAFRIMPEGNNEVVLDFCVYSEAENRATVVCRIRVSRAFLPNIRNRLREAFQELPA